MSGLENLSSFPRLSLFDKPTPIQRLDSILGAASNGVRLFVKRDDFMGLGGGGNKLRKLEFLLGAARAQGADTVITVGNIQSNHARLTAAAACRAGLRCELVLSHQVPRHDIEYERNGNILLDRIFGATLHILPSGADVLAVAGQRAAALRNENRSPYVFGAGGSTPLGCLGYAHCAQEIIEQSRALNLDFAHIIVPNGSSGTHAGLAAGFHALGLGAHIVKSFTVLAPPAQAQQATYEIATAALRLLNIAAPLQLSAIEVSGDQRGEAYGIPTPAMLAAVTQMAQTEGLLLDPVYSGKAFAGLLADIRAAKYPPGANILFIMTGGIPGLYAYRTAFESGFS